MGLHSVISHATSKMKRGDTTNSRTLGKWIRRVTGIAQDLEKSHDIAKQRRLETVVADVAQRLASTETDQAEGATSHFAPRVYQKRKEILSEADKTLDTIQPPPKGHPEAMKKAMSNDERALGSMLEDLSQADDGLLKEVSELVPITEQISEQTMGRSMPQTSLDGRTLTRTSSRALTLPNEEKAYEQFEKKLVSEIICLPSINKGNAVPTSHQTQLVTQADAITTAPSIMIAISDMGSDNGETNAQFIPLDHTFCALADSLTDFNTESFLPDFWSKETDPTHNCITESGVWWEWQDPSKKVIDAINKEGHIGIETVCKEVEYVVVLVKKGEIENGIPIEIPRTCRQRTFPHLQQHFPNHIVSQVRRLQLGDDVRDVVFDSRSFRHQTNPLFVELQLSIDPTQQNSMVVAEVEMVPRIDKGKGKAIDG